MTDETLDDDPHHAEEPSPDRVFVIRLATLLEHFTVRQGEILRLASYMDEREAEIDNAAQRARDLIRDRLGEPDEGAVDRLISVFTAIDGDDLGDKDLTPQERQDAIVTGLQEVSASLPEGHDTTYIEAVLRAIQAPPGANMLRSSLLVLLVGELEMLVSLLARACVERHPAALDDSGRTFTWSQISRYESIADMRDAVVDRTIEDVMRGSLTEWIDYFVSRFKISPVEPASRFPAQEAIQRRHCVVHNAGLVSSTYLERLSKFRPTAEVDDELVVDSEYLRNAADALYMVAFALTWSLGYKLCAADDERATLATTFANRTYFLLQERRFGLVKQIGATAPLDKIDEITALTIRVNHWLAHKLLGEFDSVRPEVEQLDVRSKSRLFNLAKSALLDEHEEASRIAQSMIRDEELRPEFLFTWPLLAGVRDFIRKKSSDPLVDPNTDS